MKGVCEPVSIARPPFILQFTMVAVPINFSLIELSTNAENSLCLTVLSNPHCSTTILQVTTLLLLLRPTHFYFSKCILYLKFNNGINSHGRIYYTASSNAAGRF